MSLEQADRFDRWRAPTGPCGFATCRLDDCSGDVHRAEPRAPGAYCAPTRCYCGSCPSWAPTIPTRVVTAGQVVDYVAARARLRAPTARAGDPATSHAAAASLDHEGDLRRAQADVLDYLRSTGPQTDTSLVTRFPRWATDEARPAQSPSGLRSRRNELVDRGLVVDTGERAILPTRRQAIIWKATP